MVRQSWDEYFLLLAEQASMRSTCSRLQVGAIIVQHNRVLGTGYNGAPKGLAHCVHDDDTPCRRSVHAEANALLHCRGTDPHSWASYVDMYVTHAPCFECAKLIINSGVSRVLYRDTYRSEEGLDILREANVYFKQVH